jgi:hypothetical protein
VNKGADAEAYLRFWVKPLSTYVGHGTRFLSGGLSAGSGGGGAQLETTQQGAPQSATVARRWAGNGVAVSAVVIQPCVFNLVGSVGLSVPNGGARASELKTASGQVTTSRTVLISLLLQKQGC